MLFLSAFCFLFRKRTWTNSRASVRFECQMCSERFQLLEAVRCLVSLTTKGNVPNNNEHAMPTISLFIYENTFGFVYLQSSSVWRSRCDFSSILVIPLVAYTVQIIWFIGNSMCMHTIRYTLPFNWVWNCFTSVFFFFFFFLFFRILLKGTWNIHIIIIIISIIEITRFLSIFNYYSKE